MLDLQSEGESSAGTVEGGKGDAPRDWNSCEPRWEEGAERSTVGTKRPPRVHCNEHNNDQLRSKAIGNETRRRDSPGPRYQQVTWVPPARA